MSAGLTLQLGALVDGAWAYTDPEQAQIAKHCRETIGWDLTLYDAWLYGDQHWSKIPRVRQVLFDLRGNLTFALRNVAQDEQRTSTLMANFLCDTLRITSRLQNRPEELVASMKEAKRRNYPFHRCKLDVTAINRIRRIYQQMVDSGERYGAQTQLAQQYKVSEATIRRILKSR